MPTLYQLQNLEWGDMVQIPDGGVYSLAADGLIVLSYGAPYRVDTIPVIEKGDCVARAFERLNLELPIERPTHSELDDILKSYERIVPPGTCADFAHTHKAGNYFVSTYNADAGGGHAFALIDGVAFNLTFGLLSRGIRAAYRIQ
jgi:hypothetical protein